MDAFLILAIGIAILVIYFLVLYILHLKSGFKKEFAQIKKVIANFKQKGLIDTLIELLTVLKGNKGLNVKNNTTKKEEEIKDSKIIDIKFLNSNINNIKNTYISTANSRGGDENEKAELVEIKEEIKKDNVIPLGKLLSEKTVISESFFNDFNSRMEGLKLEEENDEDEEEYASSIGHIEVEYEDTIEESEFRTNLSEPTEEELNEYINKKSNSIF